MKSWLTCRSSRFQHLLKKKENCADRIISSFKKRSAQAVFYFFFISVLEEEIVCATLIPFLYSVHLLALPFL